MAGELQVRLEPNVNVQILLWNAVNQVWNDTIAGFVTYNVVNLAQYGLVVPAIAAGSRLYRTNFPAGLPAGWYFAEAFVRAGAQLAEDDELVAAEAVEWTGTAVASTAAAVLAPNGLNLVVPAEPSAKPTWGTTHLNGWLSWLGALGLNPMQQSPTTQVLRNFANNATVATRSVSEDGGTFTLSVGPWS